MGKRIIFPDEQLPSPPNKRPKLEDDPVKANAKLINSAKDLQQLLVFQQDATSVLRQSSLFMLPNYFVSLTKP